MLGGRSGARDRGGPRRIPWRARFCSHRVGDQLELYSDAGQTHYVTNGSTMRLELDRPQHIEAGDLVHAGEITITDRLPRRGAAAGAEQLDARERELLGLVADEPRRRYAASRARRLLARTRRSTRRADPRTVRRRLTRQADALLAEHGERVARTAVARRLRRSRSSSAGSSRRCFSGKEPLATWPGLFRLSPVAYDITMRRESHVTHQLRVGDDAGDASHRARTGAGHDQVRDERRDRLYGARARDRRNGFAVRISRACSTWRMAAMI